MADESRNPNWSIGEITDWHVTRLSKSEHAITHEVDCAI